MALPRTLLSSFAALSDDTQVHGWLRNAGDAAAGYHAGDCGRALTWACGDIALRSDNALRPDADEPLGQPDWLSPTWTLLIRLNRSQDSFGEVDCAYLQCAG